MSVFNNEDPADPSVHEPKVTDAPKAFWLTYGPDRLQQGLFSLDTRRRNLFESTLTHLRHVPRGEIRKEHAIEPELLKQLEDLVASIHIPLATVPEERLFISPPNDELTNRLLGESPIGHGFELILPGLTPISSFDDAVEVATLLGHCLVVVGHPNLDLVTETHLPHVSHEPLLGGMAGGNLAESLVGNSRNRSDSAASVPPADVAGGATLAGKSRK